MLHGRETGLEPERWEKWIVKQGTFSANTFATTVPAFDPTPTDTFRAGVTLENIPEDTNGFRTSGQSNFCAAYNVVGSACEEAKYISTGGYGVPLVRTLVADYHNQGESLSSRCLSPTKRAIEDELLAVGGY